ncbi:hypothetical protein [Hyphomicrobium sp.]|jgi:hypothetical protein|uniref:hypothetical protein n=1 Tax=Hyphomicrobium sp. TaxID=82 RepID=UPI002C6436C3|nr:hypothetical protein [Hyphomicrobium sp.]HVZ03649.1 hypothetical protein [Hyphomicrobium sp.]
MPNLIIHPIMILAAFIASYFVARNAVNFSIVQMVVALLLITGLVAVAAFWEFLADRLNAKKR